MRIRRMAELEMTFRVVGDIARLRIPSWSGVSIRSELWRHTCFEVFVAREGEAGYHEFNFAPSGEWMAYEFRGYRDGRMIANETLKPRIVVRSSRDAFELEAAIRLDLLSDAYPLARLCIGLSAVIEANDGTSYWAIRHPREKPDFHDRAGIALRLDGRDAESQMKGTAPRGITRREVGLFLRTVAKQASVADRIEALSRRFIGYPYQTNPLIGSADRAEVFTASLQRFDCVTYIETIVALAHASNFDEFADSLRHIRYDGGRIEWRWRNHYIARWIRNNLREQILKSIALRAVPTVANERVLNVVDGLPAQRARMKWVPKRAFPRLKPHLKTGDLIFFVSTRKHLDVFHAGIIKRDDNALLMRHASRSRGGVVEQKLGDFLKANRMAGVMVARPR